MSEAAPAAIMPAILTISGLGKRFGGFVALDNINLSVAPGERLGLIGPNGSGKSTLVNCLCGTLQNETGSVVFDGHNLNGLIAHQRTRLGLARSFQLPKPFHTLDLVDNLRVPLIYTVNARHGHRRHHLSAAQAEERCHELLRQVSLIDKARRLPRDLTQVEMRKLELARAVATEPRLLFADEAMAGLSHAEIEDILAVLLRLNEQGITIVLIEHIMSAVMSFSTRLVVLVAGQKIADGPPQEVVRNPEVERAYLGE
jgi:branched-chain amino acid transport system ATP-binding protein